jgi:CheY-like chemotaxis protein
MPNILLVEDSPVTQRMLSVILHKHGHHVIIAADGLEALQCLEFTSVDLVLCDLSMPKMDGLTFLRHLKVDKRYAHLPVIMLTASGWDEDYESAQAEGVSGFLTKPTSSHELIETVNLVFATNKVKA